MVRGEAVCVSSDRRLPFFPKVLTSLLIIHCTDCSTSIGLSVASCICTRTPG